MSAVFLVLLSPIFLGILLSILVIDGRPIFFIQSRPGRSGNLFQLIKFRTMKTRVNFRGNSNGPTAGHQEESVTRLGAVLRRWSLDELPQLVNILLGHMSFVGPRPLLAEYLTLYNPQQLRRHLVRPGLTGLAQVHGRNGLDWAKKIEYDLQYVDHVSVKLDLTILLRSIAVVVRSEGVHPSSATSIRPPSS